MQTALAPAVKESPDGNAAEAILRSCVHCGFCNATCPTYQLLGDERDGPRGRIYLIKQALEGAAITERTRIHLDRCLTCRACETTCPSGVQYHSLLDIGRALVERQTTRPLRERALRALLHAVLPYPKRFGALLRVGQALRAFLPSGLRAHIPPRQHVDAWPRARHARTMLVLDGCVQPAAAPAINRACAKVLDALGVSLLRAEGGGCCGALSQHFSQAEAAQQFARQNIDAWWPLIERGAEAIVITASGCAPQVKDYAHLLRLDAAYAHKAARVAALAKDVSEVLAGEDLAKLPRRSGRIAFHSPCTLQHGQKLPGKVEQILTRCGFELTAVPDAHLCCGSAGTYSILQRELSQRLLANKVQALQTDMPQLIATANIGCLLHLQTQARVRVCHWIELLAAETTT